VSVELLLNEFARLSDGPDAIGHLRRFVLDLAVRGKLTLQDPQDEPAVQLLRRIESTLHASPAKGRRRANASEEFDNQGGPFDLPDNWVWTRTRQITRDRGQTSPTGDFTYIDVTAIDKTLGRISAPAVLSAADAPSRARKCVGVGDVLYSCVRPYLLNVAVVEGLIQPPPIASTAFAVLDGLGLVEPRYLWTVLRSPYFVDCVEAKMRGQSYPAINDSDFALLPVPLPPLAEQRRIVAKVDEMMRLCDWLANAQATRDERRDRLRLASLARLIAPREDALDRPSEKSARFCLKYCDRMLTKREHVGDLRRTILHLAVRGLLVKRSSTKCQPPNGADAAGRTDVDRLAMTLPAGWRWVRVQDVATARLGKMLDQAKNRGRDYPYLRNTNVHWFEVRLDSIKTVPLDEGEVEEYLLRPGDVLICEGGHGIARAAVWREGPTEMAFQKALHRVRPSEHLVSDFLAYCIFVYFDAGVLQRHFTGVGIPHFTGKALASLTLPLPPVAEQRLIVSEVGEMMGVCDQLESALTAAETGRANLLQAALEEALGTHPD
jgi:type I restriction enzyme S subunit